jgi:hypothetical protein
MTQEEKDLLLQDLCGRLPYGVKAYVKNWSKLDRKYYEGVYTVESINPSLNNILACSDKFCVEVLVGYDDYEIKPYLLPLSSMTEEQKEELLYNYIHNDIYFDDFTDYFLAGELWHDLCISMDILSESINWLNKNHFDWRGLIPKGLAIDCTNLNIY